MQHRQTLRKVTYMATTFDADGSFKAAQNRLLEIVNDMNLEAKSKDYNTQDARFIRAMIKHHEMAVEMSDKEVDKGKESEAITLAKAIRKAQKGEIDQMKKWLKDRDLSEDDGSSM